MFLVIAELSWAAGCSVITPSHGNVPLTSVDLGDLCHEHVPLQHVLKPNHHMTPQTTSWPIRSEDHCHWLGDWWHHAFGQIWTAVGYLVVSRDKRVVSMTLSRPVCWAEPLWGGRPEPGPEGAELHLVSCLETHLCVWARLSEGGFGSCVSTVASQHWVTVKPLSPFLLTVYYRWSIFFLKM